MDWWHFKEQLEHHVVHLDRTVRIGHKLLCEQMGVEPGGSGWGIEEAALQWELLWRLEPNLGGATGYLSERYSNPFLDPTVDGLRELSSDWIEPSLEARRVIEAALRVESDPDWLVQDAVGTRFVEASSLAMSGELGDSDPKTLRHLEYAQELFSRTLLRGGGLERVRPLLQAHFTVLARLAENSGSRDLGDGLVTPVVLVAMERSGGHQPAMQIGRAARRMCEQILGRRAPSFELRFMWSLTRWDPRSYFWFMRGRRATTVRV